MAQLRQASNMGSLLPGMIDPRTGLPSNTGFSGGMAGPGMLGGGYTGGMDGMISEAPEGEIDIAATGGGDGDFSDDVRTGNAQGPRDRAQSQQPQISLRSPSANSVTPPSMEAQVGSMMAPDMPNAPTPMAGMGSMATGAAFQQPSPFQLNETPGRGLYSKAGGLLGGGQSVLGSGEKGEGLPSELLALLALLGQ